LLCSRESLHLVFSRIFEPCVYWCFGHLPHVCLCNGVLGFQIGAWMRWLCFHVPCPCIKLCLFQRISYNFWLDRSFWKHRECLSVSGGWIRTLILLVFFFFFCSYVDFNSVSEEWHQITVADTRVSMMSLVNLLLIFVLVPSSLDVYFLYIAWIC
jgi:hypothetical protein